MASSSSCSGSLLRMLTLHSGHAGLLGVSVGALGAIGKCMRQAYFMRRVPPCASIGLARV